MSYVKRSPTSSKDGRISVTEESEGVAPCSYEHCQNYYQFISKELPFIRKDQMRVSEIIGCRSCSHCVCDSGGTRQQPGEHHY